MAKMSYEDTQHKHNKLDFSSKNQIEWLKPYTCIVKLLAHAYFRTLKAAESVTFDLLIIELMFLFFKNTVKKLKFRYIFYQFRKS